MYRRVFIQEFLGSGLPRRSAAREGGKSWMLSRSSRGLVPGALLTRLNPASRCWLLEWTGLSGHEPRIVTGIFQKRAGFYGASRPANYTLRRGIADPSVAYTCTGDGNPATPASDACHS